MGQDDLFDKNQATLWRISTWANSLAPIMFFIHIVLAFWQVFEYSQIANFQYQTDLFGLFSQGPVYILDVLFRMTRVFLQGSVYYLVLKGIALGIDMIVETDINYREQKAEGGAE